jgi:hypothetical protein
MTNCRLILVRRMRALLILASLLAACETTWHVHQGPNQAPELTATRRVFTFYMFKTVPVKAALAIGGGGAFAADISAVELGERLSASDGFRVKLDVVAFPPTREGRRVPPLSFVTEVPRDVGRTTLGIVWLEIERHQGRSSLATPLDRRIRGKVVRCSVEAEKRLAEDCVLHFQYAPIGEPERWVKDYVLRLKYHIAPTQKT